MGDWPTCRPDERVGDLRRRTAEQERWPIVVVGPRDVVLGTVVPRRLEAADDRRVTDVLIEGPTSVRADADPVDLLRRMEQAETGTVLVTTGQGELLGTVVRDRLERVVDGLDLAEPHHHDHG